MNNNDILRTNHVVGDLLRELKRPDRDEKRIEELRTELFQIAWKDEHMNNQITMKRSELLALLVAIGILALGLGYLMRELGVSRANERALSKENAELNHKLFLVGKYGSTNANENTNNSSTGRVTGSDATKQPQSK
jgi:hypothetical protein